MKGGRVRSTLGVRSAVALLAAAAAAGGCGCAGRAAVAPVAPALCTDDTTHRGDLVLTSDDEVEAAQACRKVVGSLVIQGGALTQVTRLGVTEVTGDVRVGPAMRLTSVMGLGALAVVGGGVSVHNNLSLTGLYLRGLTTLRGALTITGNSELAAISVPRLASVPGNVTVQGNGALLRLELLTLREIGGRLQVVDNSLLSDVVALALRSIRGGETVRGNPKLSADVLRRVGGDDDAIPVIDATSPNAK